MLSSVDIHIQCTITDALTDLYVLFCMSKGVILDWCVNLEMSRSWVKLLFTILVRAER